MAANESLAEPTIKEALSFKIFKITLYSLILLLCLIGNSLVVYIVCRTKRMRIASNLLILNLALCDLVTPITSIPFDLAMEENDYIWPFGRVLCKTLWPLATLSATSASLTLAFISLDRYRVIMHPFKQRLSSKQVKYSIFGIHLLSLIFILPYIYFLELVNRKCEETWPEFSYRQAYTLTLFIVQYGIPLAFMTVMYTITLSNLRLSSGMFESAPHQRPSPRVSEDGNIQLSGSRLDITRDCQRKASRGTLGQRHDSVVSRDQNIRATKMFVTVVIVFATCRLPNEIFWLWSDFGDGHDSEYSNVAGIICRMFTYTNSIFNPVIYWIFSKDFKRGFNGIFTSLWKRKRSGSSVDELDQSERRFHKLSTLSDSISFVLRKVSRSRSGSNCPPELRENQAFLKEKNGGSEQSSLTKVPKISIDFSERSVNGWNESSRTGKKKSLTTQFEDSNFLGVASQSRLAKLSEESLCDTLEQQNVKTRRFGTVEPPRKKSIGECHVSPVKRGCNDDLSTSPNEVADETTPSSVLAETGNRQEQPTFEGSFLEIKLSSDDNENIKGYNDACEKQHSALTPVYFKYLSSHFNETTFKETTC